MTIRRAEPGGVTPCPRPAARARPRPPSSKQTRTLPETKADAQ